MVQHPMFACSMCHQLPPEPFSCNGCGQIICKECFKEKIKSKKDSSCPHCQAPLAQIIPNAFAKRLIGDLVIKCPNLCGEEYTVLNSRKHKQICPLRQIQCVDCKNSIVLTKFEEHIWSEHLKSALQRFDADFMKKERLSRVKKCDRIAKAGNAHGNYSQIGMKGKFYCGMRIEACDEDGCCDGHCGPTNGCNCRACQFIDVEARNLPPGFLVNRNGHSCRFSKGSNQVHCGALIHNSTYCEDLKA